MSNNPHQEYDRPWKKMLGILFRPALELCFPAIAADIDWAKDVEFLDKEFEQIVRMADTGDRHVDKLAKVWRRNGAEEWVLLHVEVQAQWEADLDRRLFDYYSRIFQRFNRSVAMVVIYADEHPRWQPALYENELWGCKVRLEFPTVKLLDLAADEDALLRNPNPFAIVVLAQVQAVKHQRDDTCKFAWKKRLAQLGYDRNYDRDLIIDLYNFVDWVMLLAEPLAEKFDDEHTIFEKERHMEYVTHIERRGREQGHQEAMQSAIIAVLEARFGEIPYPMRESIQRITNAEVLKKLHHQSVIATNLAHIKDCL